MFLGPTHTDTHLSLGVAEDDGLCDGQGVVQVTQGVKLPLLSLHGDEELLDPLQGQLITGETRHQVREHSRAPEGQLNMFLCTLENDQ